MKIQSYDVSAKSERTSVSYESKQITIMEKLVKAEPREDADSAVQVTLSQDANKAMKSSEWNESAAFTKANSPLRKSCGCKEDESPRTPEEAKIKLLELMFYALTGKKMKFRMPELSLNSGNMASPNMPSQAAIGTEDLDRVVTVEERQFTLDMEYTAYSATGQINAADGQTINVNIQMNLSRVFMSHSSLKIETREPVMKDPLIISYGGNAASLSGETFAFDVDVDGRMDQIYSPGEGSGLLALDRNGDRKINDGSELFGPSTGAGFEELRAYDQDKNGWIDENDDIFQNLLVWSRDKNGNDQLFKLLDLNIGAIFLGDTATEFSIKDAENTTKGIMRSTSFFLKEDKSGAGLISHIDLAL